MEDSEPEKEIITGSVMSDISPQFLIHRLPENGQLLGPELLQNHNGLVVDLGGTDFIPVSYTSEDLLAHDLTEEDRNLAAALVAVQFSQQQKQQQVQDSSVATIPTINSASLASKVLDDQQIILSDKGQSNFLQIVSTDNMYIEKNTLPKLSLENEDAICTIKLEEDVEKRDSDSEARIDTRSSRKNLPHKKRLSRKLKRNCSTAKKVKCNLCEQVFTSNEDFHQHQLLCTTTITPVTAQSFNCQLCNTPFTEQLKFFEHLKSHYEPGGPSQPAQSQVEHAEEEPEEKEEEEEEVEVAQKQEEEEEQNESKEDIEKETILSSLLNLTCIECSKTFRKQKTYEAHIRDFHSKSELNEFSEPEDLMEGINVVVEGAEPMSDDDTEDKGWYREEELQQTEEDLKELEAEEHVCHICHQPFPLRAILLQHLITCRANAGVTEPTSLVVVKKKNKSVKKPSSLECTECDRVFTHRNSLMYHIKGHMGLRPHQCDQCGKSFFASSALKVHMRLHTGVKPYHCDQCGKDFRQWGDLKYHQTSIHSNEKAFQCEYCGKDFARKYSLIVHRRIHTGEKNYKCEFCGKTFRASSYLHNHRRIHTGEKPHSCEICGKPFRVRSDMKRHLKTHGKRPATKSAGYTKITKKENEDLSDNTSELHINEQEYAVEALQQPIKSESTIYTNGHQLFLVSYSEDSPTKTVDSAWIQSE